MMGAIFMKFGRAPAMMSIKDIGIIILDRFYSESLGFLVSFGVDSRRGNCREMFI